MRHGQTNYNVKKIINCDPRKKIGLNRTGKKQVLDVSMKLKDVEFDVIYASEFLRTQQSARIINKNRGVPMRIDKRVNEAKIGFEGRVDLKYQSAALEDPLNFKIKGGENWYDVRKRVSSFLDNLREENYSCVLVVTHEFVVQVVNGIVSKLSNKEARFTRFKNTEFIEFEL